MRQTERESRISRFGIKTGEEGWRGTYRRKTGFVFSIGKGTDSLSARIHFQIFYHQYLAQDLAFG